MSKNRKLVCIALITAILSLSILGGILSFVKNVVTKNAVPLSQNDAYGANEIGFYETPEGVIIYCDESHVVSNDLWRYTGGQFTFGISPEEFNSNPWSNKSMTIASNAEIRKAECYDMDGNIIREEKPVNNLVTIKSDCSKFILYVRYDDTLYSAKFSRVFG